MGWRECHGVENVITMTALSTQIDGVEGVSWCGECYHNDCFVHTDRWGGGSVMVSWCRECYHNDCLVQTDRWVEGCHGVENVITMTALSRQIDG